MYKLKFILLLIIIIAFQVSCDEDEPVIPDGQWYIPAPETTFDWDLRGDIPSNTSYAAKVIDIDAFENDAAFVANLHAQNKKVFAYVSVGSIEDWRPDVADFPNSIIGNNYPGWEGEKFIDISNIEALAPIMRARLDMIKEKGFDGVEPDNIDLNSWTTAELGFEITETDIINYSNWLANEAHSRGLSIGQKNASDLAPQLVNTFDWILLEDAFYDDFATEAQIYITKNKAVFATEYTDNYNAILFDEQVCPQANTMSYTAILKHRELDGYIKTCD